MNNTAKDLTVASTIFTIQTKKNDDFKNFQLSNKATVVARKINKLKASLVNDQEVITAFWGNGENEKITMPMGRKMNEPVSGCETLYTDAKIVKNQIKALHDVELQELQQMEMAINKRREEIKEQQSVLDGIIAMNND